MEDFYWRYFVNVFLVPSDKLLTYGNNKHIFSQQTAWQMYAIIHDSLIQLQSTRWKTHFISKHVNDLTSEWTLGKLDTIEKVGNSKVKTRSILYWSEMKTVQVWIHSTKRVFVVNRCLESFSDLDVKYLK